MKHPFPDTSVSAGREGEAPGQEDEVARGGTRFLAASWQHQHQHQHQLSPRPQPPPQAQPEPEAKPDSRQEPEPEPEPKPKPEPEPHLQQAPGRAGRLPLERTPSGTTGAAARAGPGESKGGILSAKGSNVVAKSLGRVKCPMQKSWGFEVMTTVRAACGVNTSEEGREPNAESIARGRKGC